MTHIADRLAHIQPFRVMEILAKAKEMEARGERVIHMEIGEPDFPSPAPVTQAAIQALQAGETHYTAALGLPELRRAIAGFYRERYAVDLPPERVVITPGASGALHLALGALIDPGTQVLMADPGYPCNRHFVRLLGGEPIAIPVSAASDYQLTPELIAGHWTPKSAAVLLASPSNPTGTLIAPGVLARLCEQVEAQDGCLLLDEIYHGLTYGVDAHSALEYSDEVFVINSFSKYFCMTGWRIGWLVAPSRYIPVVDKLAQNIFLAASTPAQYAALAALRPETIAILEQRRAEFEMRRDYLVPALRELGFEIPVEPRGAFYIYADCRRFATDSMAFATRVLEEAKVAITPGADFSVHAPERFVRFAYTTSLENLREGVARLKALLG